MTVATDRRDRLAVGVVEAGPVVEVKLDGDLDLATIGAAEARLAQVDLAHRSSLVVDLGGLGFVDSAGVHLLLRLRRRLTGTPCALVVLAPAGCPAAALLEVTGLDGELGLVRDRAPER